MCLIKQKLKLNLGHLKLSEVSKCSTAMKSWNFDGVHGSLYHTCASGVDDYN